MEIWQLGLLTLAGVGAGWINVLAGGGSLLSVPVMIFLGLPGPVANGTNRIAIIAQNIAAVASFFRQGFSDFRLSATLAAAAAIGAYFGANVGVGLDGPWFNRTLALIIVAVMILMATGRDAPSKDARSDNAAGAAENGEPRNLVLGHILMVGAGFWGGFIQVAVGFVMMPILYRVMGLDLVRVNMHKVFIALMFSFVALGVFASKVDIAWQAGLALALGNAVGGALGARTAVAKGAPFIKKTLYVVLAAMAVKLVFF
ncbi:MAG: sulfite exporter TauE/SafE family protein [Pseudomonadota bacterium]